MNKLMDLDPQTKSAVLKSGCIIFLAGTTGYIAYTFYQRLLFKKLIKQKQVQLENKKKDLYAKLVSLNTPMENMERITNQSLEGLINDLEAGLYNPVDVLQAFQVKALLMDKEYNFITDINSNAEMDALASSSSKKGMLKGIPISIKDVFQVKDCSCTFGMPSMCMELLDQDCITIRSLRMQGAVPFVMTNVSQTCESIESSNPVFGQTLNPYNKARTSGGSSGGEGSILASGASIIGLGSDIGGSIRIPSSYCGIFGLKPTSYRFSRRNMLCLYPTQNLIVNSFGPMARRFDDLLLLFKGMACGDLYRLDPYTPPLCFNEKLFLKKRPLRIGYYFHLGESQVHPVPAVVRAVELAKSALEAAGHVLLAFDIPDPDEAMFGLFLSCFFSDGGQGYINDLIKNNPVDPSLSTLVNLLKIPNILKKIGHYIFMPFNKNYSRIMKGLAGVQSVHELWSLKDRLEAYREKVLSKWQEEQLDGIICPVLPITAPLCQTSQDMIDIGGYTVVYNVLDYPAGSVPVTKVTQGDIDQLLTSYPTDTATHRKVVEVQRGSLGMPVGVQCVSLPWRDEVCLRIMRDIDLNLK